MAGKGVSLCGAHFDFIGLVRGAAHQALQPGTIGPRAFRVEGVALQREVFRVQASDAGTSIHLCAGIKRVSAIGDPMRCAYDYVKVEHTPERKRQVVETSHCHISDISATFSLTYLLGQACSVKRPNPCGHRWRC
eukprot:1185802-Prorocentrum_minimum.AAC.2